MTGSRLAETSARRAVKRVLALHLRVVDDCDATNAWCGHCASYWDGVDYSRVQWPCPTVRAITDELGE